MLQWKDPFHGRGSGYYCRIEEDLPPRRSKRQAGEVAATGRDVGHPGCCLVIHKAPEDKAETAADGSDGKAGTETPVAFFQCASEIAAFDVAGANVAVACADGQVLQLFAAVLQP